MLPVWPLEHPRVQTILVLGDEEEIHPPKHRLPGVSFADTLVDTGVSLSNSTNRSTGCGLEGVNPRPTGHIWPTDRSDMHSIPNKFEHANI